MTTLTSNDPSSSNASPTFASSDSARSSLSLRVVQSGGAEQTVVLPIGKCTVGSSERCQVPLSDVRVRPLHCLIVNEGTTATVTRWAPGALLNGQDFTTAPFQPGDCLSIGGVEMSLVAVESAPEEASKSSQPAAPAVTPVTSAFAALPTSKPTASPSPTPATTQTDVVETSKMNAASQLESDRLVTQLWTANYKARKRCRQLVGSLRTVRNEVSGFDQRVDELQQQLNATLADREEIFLQLSELQTEAAQRENQTTEEIDRLIAELTAAYEKSGETEAAVAEQSQLTEQLQAELAELRDERSKWEQVRDSGELQRTKLAQALADSERSIETLQAEIDQAREAANRADESRAEQNTQLAELQQEFEAVCQQRDQLVTAQAESQKYCQDIEQALADSEQNLAVFQLELEKFQISSRKTEQEFLETSESFADMEAKLTQLTAERDQLVAKRTEYQLREQGWEHELSTREHQVQQLSEEIEQLRVSVTKANQSAGAQVSQVEELQQQLVVLTTERDQLLVAQAEQVQNLKAWEETVAARDRRIQELEEEHDGICQVLQSVEKGAFEQVDFCNKLEKQLATLREERDQMAASLPEQQEHIKQLESTLAERDEQITLLSDELSKAAERQGELEKELEEGTTSYRALEAELAELSTRCEQLTTAQTTSDQSKATVEQMLAEHQERVTELQQQLDTAQQQRQELELMVADGSRSSESLVADHEQLRAKFEQLTTERNSEKNRREELETQLAEGQQNIDLFQVDLQSMRMDLERSTELVSSLQEERETLNLQLTGLRDELASREETKEAVGIVDDELQQKYDALAFEFSAAKQKLEEVQQQSDSNQGTSDSEQLVAQLENEKLELARRVEQQDEQARQLTAELEAARSQMAASQSEFEQLSEQYQRSQSELAQAHQGLQLAEQTLQSLSSGEPLSEVSTEVALSEVKPVEVEATAESFEGEDGLDFAVDSVEEPVEYPTSDLEINAEPAVPQLDGYASDEYLSEVTEEVYEPTVDSSLAEDYSTNDLADYGPVAESAEYGPENYAEEATSYEENVASEAAYQPTETSEEEVTESFVQPVEVSDEPTKETEKPAEDFQPPSFIEQYQHLLEEDGQPELEPARPVATPPAPVENKLGAELDAGGDEDEAALEAYMSNMLARMRGDSNTEASEPAPTVASTQEPAPTMTASDTTKQAATLAGGVAEPENHEPLDLESLKQSSKKPALPTDMAAMRELANSSARVAIAKHHKKRHLEKALALFFVCLIFICVGAYLILDAIAAQEFLGMGAIGGGGATLVGLMGGFKFLGQLLLAIREGSAPKRAKK